MIREKRLVFLLTLLTLWCCGTLGHAATKSKIDSLVRISKKVSAHELADIYNKIAWEYRNTNTSSCDSFAQLALTLSQKLKYEKGCAQALLRKSLVQRNNNRLDSALKLANTALAKALLINNHEVRASAYNTLASIFLQQNRLRNAVTYFHYSMILSLKQGDSAGYAASANNLGVIYNNLNLNQKALEYYVHAFEIFERLNDSNGMADELNNIAGIMMEANKLDTAIVIYKNALAYNESAYDIRDVATIKNNIGLIYLEQKSYKEALDYLLQSLQLNEDLGDIQSISNCLINIASCYMELDMYHSADRYANEALTLTKAYNLKSLLKDTYELLYKSAEKQANFEQALTFHEQLMAVNNELIVENAQRRIAALELQASNSKKYNEKLEEKHRVEISKLIRDEREKTILQYISIIGIVLILFILIVYVVFFIMRKEKA